MSANEIGSDADTDRDVIITRVFDAPARLLFEAYSKPEHLMKWFGPKGWPLTLCEVDFRKGGRFRFQMTGPGGRKDTPFGGEYLEIEKNRKIVYDNGFETAGAGRMVVSVTFDEHAGRTTLTIHTRFASAAMKNEYMRLGYEQGTSSALDQLVDVMVALRAAEARSAEGTRP